MDDEKTAELPETISLSTLKWLLAGVTSEYVNTLERQGVLEKTERGRYRVASIRRYIRQMRERGGTDKWNLARTKLAEERAEAARLTRLQRQGELLERPVVDTVICATFKMVRDRLLGISTKAAPQLHGAVSVPQTQALLDGFLRESLESIAENGAAEVMARIGQATTRDHGRRRAS